MDELDDEVTVNTGTQPFRLVVMCTATRCNRLYVIDIDLLTWDGDAPACPACNGKTKLVEDADLGRYSVCSIVDCSQYLSIVPNTDNKGRCVGSRDNKHGACNCALAVLTPTDIDELTEDTPDEPEETGVPSSVRQLKAWIAKARAWIRSSGSHHRSSSGSHTASAREMHSGAHATKAQVRNNMASQLNALAAEVEKLGKQWAAVAKAGRVAAKDVLNK